MTGIISEDLQNIAADESIPWGELRGASVLVTGATGTVGSALVRALWAANREHKLCIRILIDGRNEAKLQALINDFGAERSSGELSHIFHCAAVTSSALMVSDPVGVIESSVELTRHALRLAMENRVKSMVYLSSMEIYGSTPQPEVFETDLGWLDLSSPRSSYPESKRLCELLCNSYHSQYGVPVKTARLAQTFGAGSSRDDTRVFAQFARSAASGNGIVLHTEGKSRGNYCYISDTVRALLLLLLKGKNGEAYNISNPGAAMTIREMAQLVADEVCGGRISVTSDIPADIEKRGYAPESNIRLNADKIMSLGWKPKYGLADMYRRMLASWAEEG